MANGVKISVLLFLTVLCVGGFMLGSSYFKEREQEQVLAKKKAEQKVAEEKRRTADAAAREKSSEAKKAEADRARAVAEKEKAVAERDAKRQEAENLKERKETAKQEESAKAKAAEAAQAEAEKAKAATAQADASRKELEAKRALEEVALKRAEEERQKAEAEAARTVAAKAVADAALAKSENERKTAEANAAAEHDRKLRMYRRAESSRAEMLELQRAERRLALEEAGLSPDEVAAADAAQQGQETDVGEGQAPTNAVAEVKWKDDGQVQSGAADADEEKEARRRRARDYVASFGPMIDKAEREGRVHDAVRYRRMLMTFVPDYVDVYSELISEAHAANREDDAKKACAELLALVPGWLRVGTMVELLNRDEGYFSRVLSDGLATKDEFVKSFRRRYDKVRREQGDKDERVAKMERICKVLATYVPDFERSPEWK